MPLQNNAPYEPTAVDLRKTDEYFVLRASGEAVQDYTAYLDKLRLYRTHQWSCAYTHKSGLTYEEARKEEDSITALLPKVRRVPNDLQDSRSAFTLNGCTEYIHQFISKVA